MMFPLTKGLVLAVACLVMGDTFAATSANSSSHAFRARLTGANEVPAVTDTRAVAVASFRFSSDFSKLKFVLRIKRGVDITEAHLHCGAAGSNGPIVVPLFGVAGPASAPLLSSLEGGLNGTVEVTATVTSASLNPNPACSAEVGTLTTLADLATAMANGQIYVNTHSVTHTSGEVRGQVSAASGGSTDTGGGTGTGTSSGSGLGSGY